MADNTLDPKKAAEAILMQGMSDPDAFSAKNRDPNVAALMAQRDQELQGLIETKRKPQGLSSNVTGIMHALSGLSYLGGTAAGKAGMDASRGHWEKSQQEEKDTEQENYNRQRIGYGLLNERIPKDRVVDPMQAAQAVLGNQMAQDQFDWRKKMDTSNLSLKRQALSQAGAPGAAKPSKFQAAFDSKSGNLAATALAKLPDVDSQIAGIDSAIEQARSYKKSSVFGAGTGPGTDMFGLRTKWSSERQGLASKYNALSLKNLVSMFAGMSRSIDTDTERAAFQMTQPSVDLDDQVNMNILLGQKSLALKTKAHLEAKKDWIASGGDEKTFQDPTENTTTVVDPNTGQMFLISKQDREGALQGGFVGLDDYAKSAVGGQ